MAESDTVRAIHASPGLIDDMLGKATIFVIFCCASQMSTAALQQGFAASLQRDWSIAEHSRRRRLVLLALAALPVGACIVPSVMTDALLTGLFVRLVTLMTAYWLTRGFPRDRDAEFLSWSIFKTGRAMLRVAA